MPTCSALKKDGEKCGNSLKGQDRMCKIHSKSMELSGPNTFAIKQLQMSMAKEMKETNLIIEKQRIRLKFEQEISNLRMHQFQEFIRTGINPDRVARDARIARETERQLALERQRQQRIQRIQQVQQENQLRHLANDQQNVHTKRIVDETLRAVEEIKKIAVPEEYRWNKDKISKTTGEIILECDLTPQSAGQMVQKYTSTDDIYNLEEGIYGKVLDGVWQYIKLSEHRSSLKNILKEELQDNVGMCGQGNLSRLCNILSAYLPGLNLQVETNAEKLGRLLPPLMEVEDIHQRRHGALIILQELQIPVEEHDLWIQPLMVD